METITTIFTTPDQAAALENMRRLCYTCRVNGNLAVERASLFRSNAVLSRFLKIPIYATWRGALACGGQSAAEGLLPAACPGPG